MKNRLIEICEQVAEDVERDVKEMYGKPFDGRTIATQFGYQAAAIKALADVLKKLIKEQEAKAKIIDDQPDVIKSVCEHRLPDTPCTLVKCKVCGDFMDIKEQTVL